MAGCQRHGANSGNDNNNQERDNRDVILKGLGEQLHQIQERLERLEAACRRPRRQEGAAHEGVRRHAHRCFQNNSSSEDEDGIKKRIFVLKILLAIMETISDYMLIFLNLREGFILMDVLIG